MKNDKLIPGLVIVLIGLAFLLDNFGYINVDWGNIWHLWPMFLIIAGVNLVFAHNRSPLATIAKIGVVVLVFGLFVFGNFGGNRSGFPFYSFGWTNNYHNNNDSDDDDDDDDSTATTTTKSLIKVEGNSNFILPYTADAKSAELHISGGGTKYILDDTTSQLFKADTKEHYGIYELSHSNVGSNYVLNFEMKDHHGIHFGWDDDHGKSNVVIFKLNPNPIWSMYIDAGAAAIDFDLSKYKLDKLTINGGAASFKVKLGQPLESTSINVSASAVKVEISIPKSAACEIETNSALSSNNFDGFTKTDDSDYQTPGFDVAKNKMHIIINGAASNFNVSRY